MNEVINVVYGFDENFVDVAMTSILSLLENNKDIDITLYLLLDNVSESNVCRLNELAIKYKTDAIIIEVSKQIDALNKLGISGYGATMNKGLTAYVRLFIDQILPEKIEKFVYIDSDTLVLGSIKELYDALSGEYVLGMIPDTISSKYKKAIGMETTDIYYNSGVMVVDFAKWKNNLCGERIFDYIKLTSPQFALFEQDVINHVLQKEIMTLNAKFNCQSQIFLYDYQACKKVYHLTESNWMSKETFVCAKNSPVIVHFSGNAFIRPWVVNSKHPFKTKYMNYANNIGMRIIDQKVPLYYYVQYWISKYLPMKMSAIIGMVMQDVFIACKYGVI